MALNQNEALRLSSNDNTLFGPLLLFRGARPCGRGRGMIEEVVVVVAVAVLAAAVPVTFKFQLRTQ